MILVDRREKDTKTKTVGTFELRNLIRQSGVQCEETSLKYGDAAFEGCGPNGPIMIGFERKTLHNMLHCIDDSQYSGFQRIGMNRMYAKSYLIIEGYWRSDEQGFLMEGFNGGTSWARCKYRSSNVMFSKLYRYLISVSLTGVNITYSQNIRQTAIQIAEHYQYFQKRWDKHTSMLEIQKMVIPSLVGKPSLALRWANALDGLGNKLADLAVKHFRTGRIMAQADEHEWLQVPGIGAKKAIDIVREIGGGRK